MSTRPRSDTTVSQIAGTADAEILTLFQTMADCWNRADAAGFAAIFTEDADYVVYDGTHLKGRPSIAELHQQLFDSVLKGSELLGAITDVRALSSDVALVHSTGAVRLRWHSRPPKGRDSIQTLVLVRNSDHWRIAAFQNTRVKPPGALQKFMLRLMTR